ncbi:MAG: cellulase family glycosylhydrolase [Eubacteriales bacterium]|nr:cellulase family glycosylhydrolase [Eubacteriales bacterium]
MSKKQSRLISFIMVIIIIFFASCKSPDPDDVTSGKESDPTKTSSQSSKATTTKPLVLEEYTPPKDGIDYDTTPLKLNQKMNIITRKVDKLMDGNKEFRFISVNGPEALDCGAFEQEDLVKSVAQMGGQVMRTYTFSVKNSYDSDTLETYIKGKGNYNETAFKRLDRLLAFCNKYGVRLIIPFIDPYPNNNGGIAALLEMCGEKAARDSQKDMVSFYSSKETKQEFFNFVKYVLNRKNSITGVKYKDDPAILAWESGNELSGSNIKYNSWMKELCVVIKENDPNHLILDGWFGVRDHAIADPMIDIVSHHFYPHIVNDTMAEEAKKVRDKSKGKKPAIIGEWGFYEIEDVEKFYDEVIDNGLSGALVWSLRMHDSRGGFAQHRENDVFAAYHWPGFDKCMSYQEVELLRATYLKAYEIQGKKPKLIQKPDVPKFIEPVKNPQAQIKFQGSTGAYAYDIQRAEKANGPWTTIGVDIQDDFHYAAAIFKDKTPDLKEDKTYYYRIRAKSTGGFSDWSKPLAVKIPKSGQYK